MIFLRGQEHSRVTRVDGKRQHPPPDRSYSVGINGAEIDEQLFRASERVCVRRFEPAKSGDVIDAARFQSENDFSEIKALYFRQFLRGPIEMFALGPQTQAAARRGPARPTGALIGGRATDLFHEQSVNAAPWIEARDPREAAVDHDADAIDRERGLGDIRRDDRAAFFIMRERGVLLGWRQVAVQRQSNEAIAYPRRADRRNRSTDLVLSRHEDQDVAVGFGREPFQLIRREVPNRIIIAANRFRHVLDVDGKSATGGSEDRTRCEIFFQGASVQRRGHDSEFQIRPRTGLKGQRAGKSDVPIEMALVEFVEKNRGDAAQLRILD